MCSFVWCTAGIMRCIDTEAWCARVLPRIDTLDLAASWEERIRRRADPAVALIRATLRQLASITRSCLKDYIRKAQKVHDFAASLATQRTRDAWNPHKYPEMVLEAFIGGSGDNKSLTSTVRCVSAINFFRRVVGKPSAGNPTISALRRMAARWRGARKKASPFSKDCCCR